MYVHAVSGSNMTFVIHCHALRSVIVSLEYLLIRKEEEVEDFAQTARSVGHELIPSLALSGETIFNTSSSTFVYFNVNWYSAL